MTTKKNTAQSPLKIYVAQLNTTAGNVAGNTQKIVAAWDGAEEKAQDLIVTPELSVSGYPLEDLVENPDLLQACNIALAKLVEKSKTMQSGLLVGIPSPDDNGNIYNEAVLIHRGKIKHRVRKQHLPNYDVFDEVRNFATGDANTPIDFKGHKLGVLICEDIWYTDVARDLADRGAEALISMNASPFDADKHEKRITDVLQKRIAETGLPVLYVNQVGAQDEIVFDGGSLAINADLSIAYQDRFFNEATSSVTLSKQGFRSSTKESIPSTHERIWRALVVGTRDYLDKNGIDEVVLGMSGGIDSAVVAAIAADAIGGDKVHLYRLPSKYTSDMSNDDASAAAKMLNSPIDAIAINDMVQSFTGALSPHFSNKPADTTEENLQARIRGTILMALSNKHGWLLLSTGNKSEVSVGYCTLYGDMNGGFNPLKDVPKTLVYALAEWRNKHYPADVLGPNGPVMPQRIITRPPSAELAPGQVDTNSLPAYEVLDDILERYVVCEQSIQQIVDETGYKRDMVESMIRKTDIAEFKRRQACPGVKITPRSFGKGRRVPISRPQLPKMLRDIKGLKL